MSVTRVNWKCYYNVSRSGGVQWCAVVVCRVVCQGVVHCTVSNYRPEPGFLLRVNPFFRAPVIRK